MRSELTGVNGAHAQLTIARFGFTDPAAARICLGTTINVSGHEAPEREVFDRSGAPNSTRRTSKRPLEAYAYGHGLVEQEQRR